MSFVRFPYRWLPRTVWKNLDYGWYCIRRGIRNVLRWVPVIWEDEDFDWEPLARVMEWKLRKMADAIGNGYTMSAPRDAKRMRICAHLLKRLREDEYFQSGGDRYDALRATSVAKADQELLGRIIGKHFCKWWD